MKKSIYVISTALCVLFLTTNVQAKVWRINNATGISADFKEITNAISSNLVLAGDTLYIEGTAVSYTAISLTKKLVLIGTGYLLSGAGANTGLQSNGQASRVSGIYLDSLGSGSTLIGLSGAIYFYSNVDDITISRCAINVQEYSVAPNSKMANIVFDKCFGNVSLPQMLMENCRLMNNIFTGTVDISKAINGLVRNNVFIMTANINNCYVSNNIFLNSVTINSSTIRYNMASNPNILPAGNGNQNGIAIATIFENTGSSDGKYMLKAGSPAIGAGEPIAGITPDLGAFGTADPYRLSGIPPIPTIYSLTVPASVPSSATTINIAFSTRSNN